MHYDHIKPVHSGGKSTTDNLRVICASCHDQRHILEKAEKMDKKKKKVSRKVNPYELPQFKLPKEQKIKWF
jgi:5-methylcytosine-specific restriction endonuclease McrA